MLNIPLKDFFREPRLFSSRLTIAGAVVLLLIIVLLARLVQLQLISHRHYATLARANRIKPAPIPAPRGLILDRNGVVLAQSFPIYTLEIFPEQVGAMAQLLGQLGKLVRLSETDLKLFHKQLRERSRSCL